MTADVAQIDPVWDWPGQLKQHPVHISTISHQNRIIETKWLIWCINLVHNKPMIYGYARVSTDGQSVDAQVRQLTKAGCKKVFRETASGAQTDRVQLAKALATLDADDVLMVTLLDRLARVRLRTGGAQP